MQIKCDKLSLLIKEAIDSERVTIDDLVSQICNCVSEASDASKNHLAEMLENYSEKFPRSYKGLWTQGDLLMGIEEAVDAKTIRNIPMMHV